MRILSVLSMRHFAVSVTVAIGMQLITLLVAIANVVPPQYTSRAAFNAEDREDLARRSGLPAGALRSYDFPLIALNWNQGVSETTRIQSANGLDSKVMIWVSRSGWPLDIVRDYSITNAPVPPTGTLSHWYYPSVQRSISPLSYDISSYTLRFHAWNLVVNTVLLSLCVLSCIIFVRLLIFLWRLRHRRCYNCGYSLGSGVVRSCPECGDAGFRLSLRTK